MSQRDFIIANGNQLLLKPGLIGNAGLLVYPVNSIVLNYNFFLFFLVTPTACGSSRAGIESTS